MGIKIEDGRVVTVTLPKFTRIECICSPSEQPVFNKDCTDVLGWRRRGKRRWIHCERVPMRCLPIVFAGKCKRCGKKASVIYDLKPASEIPAGLTELTREHCVETVGF